MRKGSGGAVWARKQPEGTAVACCRAHSLREMGMKHARCVLENTSPENGSNTNVNVRHVPQLFGKFLWIKLSGPD